MTRLLFILTLALAPALSHANPPARRAPAADQAAAPAPATGPRKPATAQELERYAEREKQAKDLEKFEGGRITEVTIIVILLLVIIIVILI